MLSRSLKDNIDSSPSGGSFVSLYTKVSAIGPSSFQNGFGRFWTVGYSPPDFEGSCHQHSWPMDLSFCHRCALSNHQTPRRFQAWNGIPSTKKSYTTSTLSIEGNRLDEGKNGNNPRAQTPVKNRLFLLFLRPKRKHRNEMHTETLEFFSRRVFLQLNRKLSNPRHRVVI